VGEAIDRYMLVEVSKKRSGGLSQKAALPWFKEAIGHLKLANVTAAVITELRGKLARSTCARADGIVNR
jgi:hypothetical protein